MMTADHLSYKRAASVCFGGLGIQTLLALVVLLYGLFASDTAAVSGSLAMLLAIPIWIAMALVFNQHRLERIESMEAEAYRASEAAKSSVFQEVGADQVVQAGRLAWMHKWFLPAISLVQIALFAGVGIARFLAHQRELDGAATPAEDVAGEPGWAISIGVGVAVLGFVFARYVAGMAKQKIWSLLNGGAAASVLCALVGFMLALAHFLSAAVNSELLLKYLPLVFDGLMVVLAAEMLLHFLLNLYVPRKAGQYPRPAFDSRVLAFIAAPDRLAASISEAINYQFGFNVSSTWFYQLLSRSASSLLLLGVLILWGLSCFAVVNPNETALVLRNGRIVREADSGLVLKRPWPFESVQKFPALAVNNITIGTQAPKAGEPILWTNQHALEEVFFIVQPSRSGARAAVSETGDLALVALEMPIQYEVTDIQKYLRLAQDGARGDRDSERRSLLRNIASAAIIKRLGSRSVDEVLGSGRSGVAQEIREVVQREFDALDAGVRVLFAGIAGVHPEATVAASFEDVVAAEKNKLASVSRAEAIANLKLASAAGSPEAARQIVAELKRLEQILNEVREAGDAATGGDVRAHPRVIEQEQKIRELILLAGGESAKILARSRAERWRLHMTARGQYLSNIGREARYAAAPLPEAARDLFIALSSAIQDSNVILTTMPELRVRANLEELDTALGALGAATSAPSGGESGN